MLTETDIATLIENGRKQEAVAGTDNELDFWPVVRLFDPISQAYWLLTEIAPNDPGMAFGLADIGLGAPELGNIELSALSELAHLFDLMGARTFVGMMILSL